MNESHTIINSLTQEETAPFVRSAFPYRSEICNLIDEPGRLCPWHWHNEVELFYMKAGSLTYYLPGVQRVFNEGDVGFINANVLHMTSSLSDSRCLQQEHIFLPKLIGGYPDGIIETRYVTPLLQNPAASLIQIGADEPSAPGLRSSMDRAFEAYSSQEIGYEIIIRNCMSTLWMTFFSRAPSHFSALSDRDTRRIGAMLQYIEAHYPESIGLNDIAGAAQISAREASRCFKRQLNTTAFEYIIELRVDRACDLLKSSALSITEIALRCGFSSASYFGKIFREKMNVTPREYQLAERKSGKFAEG